MTPQSLKSAVLGLFAASGLMLGGCATGYDNHSYGSHEVGQAMDIAYGTVEDVRHVQIRGNDEPGIGAVTGAVIGGAVGSEIGEGDAARVVGVVGGAIVGGMIGHAIEEDVNHRDGYEYTVRREDGRTFTIVQQTDGPPIRVGTKVRIIYGEHDRIVPVGSGDGYYDDRRHRDDHRSDDHRSDGYDERFDR